MVPQRTRQVELVGRKIRRLRKERKLTQSELASRIGIQQSDLSRIERGEYRVSLDTLFRMLAEFKVSVAEFFDEGQDGSLGPREVLMVQQFNALERPEQEAVRHLMARRSEASAAPGNGPSRRDEDRR
jgi:transcriptional regulator with XRE-family HTH domain